MTLTLTDEQSRALQSGEPLRLQDPQTRTIFVLVAEEAYRRVESLLEEGPLTKGERDSLLRHVWKRAEWDDPVWDEYAKLIPQRSSE